MEMLKKKTFLQLFLRQTALTKEVEVSSKRCFYFPDRIQTVKAGQDEHLKTGITGLRLSQRLLPYVDRPIILSHFVCFCLFVSKQVVLKKSIFIMFSETSIFKRTFMQIIIMTI